MKILIGFLCLFFPVLLLQAQSVLPISQLDSIINSSTNDKKPGLSIGIVRGGKLIYHHHRGLASLEYDVPISDKTVFELASVSKQFTAACIGILVQENKISVKDDIRKYIPELPEYTAPISINDLLHHTSGIRNYNVLNDLKGINRNFEGQYNHKIYELIFAQKGVNNLPNEKMLYSNSNYVLLALIIERVSGKTFQQFAEENLFEPLGMHHTGFKRTNYDIVRQRAYPYYYDGNQFVQHKSMDVCVGAGGMYSTMNDLAQWASLLANDKALHLKKFLFQQQNLSNEEKNTYARGLFIVDYEGHQIVHHGGINIGLRTHFLFSPEEDLAIIVLTNSEHINATNLTFQILDLILKPKTTPKDRVLTKYKTTDASSYSKFIGDYQEVNSDLKMHVFLENDTLKAQSSFGANGVPLSRISENAFTRASTSSVVYTFEVNDKVAQKAHSLTVNFGGGKFYMEKAYFIDEQQVNPKEFVGTYYSPELDVVYQIAEEKGKLNLSYPNQPKLRLEVGQKDEFGANRRTRYVFKRNDDGKVVSFEVASEGTVKDILFLKQNTAE